MLLYDMLRYHRALAPIDERQAEEKTTIEANETIARSFVDGFCGGNTITHYY